MKRATILLIALIFAFAISDVSAISVGIAPSSFTIEDALKGETFDQKLTVFNGDDEACNYEFEGTGNIGDWISFYALDEKTQIATIEVPGKSSEKVIARFSVPPETPNGIYTGMIYVQTIPKVARDTTEEMGAVAHVVLRAPSKVTIVVGSGVPAEEETITAEGDLIAMSTVDEPSIGQVIEILATFDNTGAIDTNAKFVGELYIDGNKADVVTSDELFTPAGETSDLAAYVSLETPGEYVILGHVLYEGKKTDTKELSFSIPETESATDSGTETETESETHAVTGTHAVTETPTPTTETDLAMETPTVTETPTAAEALTPTPEADLATETPSVTEAPAVTETPTPTSETVLTTETPAGTEAETDTKVPGFGIIGALIATVVVFVIAKKSGQKGGRGKTGEK